MSEDVSARRAALTSWELMDGSLHGDAELFIGTISDRARVLGAFQRSAQSPYMDSGSAWERRASGGPEVAVGPRTVHVALALRHPAALLACDAQRIVNRHVRPLLRALGATGLPAAFFGRDWISVRGRPVAWVGFAHDAGSGRTLFEAFVAVATPFAPSGRVSFRGKEPATLDSLSRTDVSLGRLVERIAEGYASLAGETRVENAPSRRFEAAGGSPTGPEQRDPPWAAVCDEAIGQVGAGPDGEGVFRVGGDLLVSRDALASLERQLPTTSDADVGRAVDLTLAAPGVALDGVRSLTSVRDVILQARTVSATQCAPRRAPP